MLLCSCASKTYTPVLEGEFQKTAEFKTGDFHYKCKIVRARGAVSVTALSSYAKGTTIKCDGKTVTFIKKNMKNEFEREMIDSTNPAVVLFEVFDYLEGQSELKPRITSDGFEYSGEISAGAFRLLQSKDSELKSISLPSADIEIVFG